ncbi:uncharacterized protein GGS22DRAFT_169768 [Annulohypoxylon maeteangense]|uniref:uncharacterized protein n=1 Tax=Annulohypoxylon maeteangense TaxID=1927788 RepID=UPI00200800D4|nr:uncharacterized protein GGS22DRAFT_169768 [Annulohypoxylon maeteangense]KAI0882570.1 hypothetical protein GGS22DRAFT_169768 [Annulohypoxylon maeteangense]
MGNLSSTPMNITSGGLGPSKDEIALKPWKYIGYRGYAQFISSDSDLLIFRPFQELSTRIALRLQDKVSALETKLAKLDELHSQRESIDVNNGTFRDETDDRDAVLDDINIALDRYHKFLIRQSDIKRLPPAQLHDVRNILRWHQHYDRCVIDEAEQDYLNQDDLICLVKRDNPPLRQLIDKSLRLRTLSIWRDKSRAPEQGFEHVSYYSDKKMNAFVSGMITAIGTFMLIVPIWILQALENSKARLAVITIFIFAFLVVLSSAMATKPFEALGATAAYAAVLMVFLQSGQN